MVLRLDSSYQCLPMLMYTKLRSWFRFWAMMFSLNISAVDYNLSFYYNLTLLVVTLFSFRYLLQYSKHLKTVAFTLPNCFLQTHLAIKIFAKPEMILHFLVKLTNLKHLIFYGKSVVYRFSIVAEIFTEVAIDFFFQY